ncbi:HEAT repeat-containing protein 1-like isoform X2 [Gigantopelta aegis]|uniref:HEAT repeat-containing protein 1-like isoform X2 n=1 Tax=Gigantopelta aegis TaxID=1735272 RepID=UPI001B888343|nr:HEAT repeat-containing protein 1-like isoform X2 [Gigantopelta aegis]
MSVFTFMGTNILRQDDQYSFHVISRILETVIPALALACEEKVTSSATACSRTDVMTTVLRVFASALPHIPRHRRVVIFTKLVATVGEKEFLWRFFLLVLEHSIVAHSNVTHRPDEETESLDKKESSPVSDDTLTFITNLAVSFPPNIQLCAARSSISYVAGLPVDKPSHTVVRPRATPKQLSRLDKEEAEIFSFAFHTAKQMRHFKYSVIHMFVHLFSSQEFISQVAEAHGGSLLKSFQRFLSELLQYIASTTKMADRNQDNPTSKFWRALLHKTYELLDKVVSLLPDSIFLTAVSGLLDHDLPTVQCKAMELLTNKLQHMKDVGGTDLQKLLPLVDQLLAVVKAMVRHVKSGDERVKTGTVALYTLNVLCRLLGETNPQLFIKVLSQSTRVLTACKDNPSVLACALLCIAEICSSLKIHVIQHLITFMPKVFKIMNRDQLIRNDLLQLGAVTAIHRMVESLPHFISPYLLEITKQVCCNLSPERGIPQKPQVQQRLKAIRHTLATVIPTRVLLPTVISCYDDAADNMQVCVPSVLLLLEEHITAMKKEDLGSFYNQLLTFFFTALSFRELHTEAELSLVTEIEAAVMKTLITMVMKMSEASFRPMLFKIFDWATRQDGSRDRVLVFYQLANRLAGKLKSLFTLFAGHIIKHAAQTLDDNNIAKTDTKYFGPGKVARHKSCLLVTCIVDCLYKCFLYDSEGFVNKERFDSLMQHLVDQIENTQPRFEERISQHLVPCITQFAVAAQDDSLWRSLNYQILLKTRSATPKIRLAALDVIDAFNKKLGEDFMSLLPETIPFLAELMEDDNEDVEKRCQAVIADMEKTLGEPLQKYF